MDKEKEMFEYLSKIVSNFIIEAMGVFGQKIDIKQAENVLNNIVAFNLKNH